MAQEEKYNERELIYSAWHRWESIGRYIDPKKAKLLAMIDIDKTLWVDYDDRTRVPLVLVETAKDTGQQHKTATVTKNLAILAGLPCYVVLYTPSEQNNPANSRWKDIQRFRVKCLVPTYDKDWHILTPKEWATLLLNVREWSAKRIGARRSLLSSYDYTKDNRQSIEDTVFQHIMQTEWRIALIQRCLLRSDFATFEQIKTLVNAWCQQENFRKAVISYVRREDKHRRIEHTRLKQEQQGQASLLALLN